MEGSRDASLKMKFSRGQNPTLLPTLLSGYGRNANLPRMVLANWTQSLTRKPLQWLSNNAVATPLQQSFTFSTLASFPSLWISTRWPSSNEYLCNSHASIMMTSADKKRAGGDHIFVLFKIASWINPTISMQAIQKLVSLPMKFFPNSLYTHRITISYKAEDSCYGILKPFESDAVHSEGIKDSSSGPEGYLTCFYTTKGSSDPSEFSIRSFQILCLV